MAEFVGACALPLAVADEHCLTWLTHSCACQVIKEVLCSQPQPPTTRPSKEECCTRKRVVKRKGGKGKGGKGTESCSIKKVLAQP